MSAKYFQIGFLLSIPFLTGAFSSHAFADDAPVFSYDAYARALADYVDDRGMVDYGGLKVNRADLDHFVTSMGALKESVYNTWDDNTKVAFWCNAYNAITLKYILDRYPIKKGSWMSSFRFPENSIRQISGVWDKITTPVMNQPMTLDAIEHNVLRKQFTEPRIHMAIVCASVGCPVLRNEPFTGAALDEQLADQSLRFLSDSTKFRIDRKKNTVYLSPIFDWFGKDFTSVYMPESGFADLGATDRAVLNFVSKHVSDKDAAYLAAGGYYVRYLDYDWSLNE